MPSEKSGVGINNVKSRYSFYTDKEVIIQKDTDLFKVCLPLLEVKDAKALLV
jgi:hypothetical protein